MCVCVCLCMDMHACRSAHVLLPLLDTIIAAQVCHKPTGIDPVSPLGKCCVLEQKDLKTTCANHHFAAIKSLHPPPETRERFARDFNGRRRRALSLIASSGGQGSLLAISL